MCVFATSESSLQELVCVFFSLFRCEGSAPPPFRDGSQAEERAPEAGAASAAEPADPAAEAAGAGAAAAAATAAAQGPRGGGQAGQDGGQVGPDRAHLEEDPHVLDGAAGGQQDGAAGAHLSVLQPDRTHLAAGTDEKLAAKHHYCNSDIL